MELRLRTVILMCALSCTVLIGTHFGLLYWGARHSVEERTHRAAAKREGDAYGVGKTGALCLDRALERPYAAAEFVIACLQRARASAHAFCEGVPKRGSLVETYSFRYRACKDQGRLWACLRIMGPVQEFCHPSH